MYSTRTLTVTVNYMDALTERGRGESGSYCDLHGYSDRGRKRREWQYVYSTRTATVTVTYTNTLIEGEEKRVAVREHYSYCCSYRDLHGYSDRGE